MTVPKAFSSILSILTLIALTGCDGGGPSPSSKDSNKSRFGAVSEVCSYLGPEGLTTEGWKNYGSQDEPDFGCNSPYKELDSSDGLPNNLAYYVEGNETQATKLYLVLNVNDAGRAVSAYQVLLEAASSLTQKVTQKRLPPELNTAILAGTRSELSMGKFKVRTFEKDWPTGRGYEVHFEIQ